MINYIPWKTYTPGVSATDERREQDEEKRSVLDAIQRKHAITLLEYLDRNGEVMVSEIQQDITRGRNLDEMLNEFENLGLISRRFSKLQEKPRRLATLVSLTDTGSSFLRLLKAANILVDRHITLDAEFEEFINQHTVPKVKYEIDPKT